MEINDDHKNLFEGLQRLVSVALSNNAITSNFLLEFLSYFIFPIEILWISIHHSLNSSLFIFNGFYLSFSPTFQRNRKWVRSVLVHDLRSNRLNIL